MNQLLDVHESSWPAASMDAAAAPPTVVVVSPRAGRLEDLIRELFGVLDLDGDGRLQETALLRMNRRLALLHHEREGKESPPPAPLLHPAARYPSFREHLLQVLSDQEPSLEAQEALVAQLISLERQPEDEGKPNNAGWCRVLPRCPKGAGQSGKRHPKDLCGHPLAVAKEYGPAALEASRQVIQAATQSLTGQAQSLALHAAPHLAALADSTRQTSAKAAAETASTLGTYWALARAGLRQQDCLASADQKQRPHGPSLELGPAVAEMRASAGVECGQRLGGEPSPAKPATQPRAALQAPGGNGQPPRPVPAPEVKGPAPASGGAGRGSHPAVPELTAPWLTSGVPAGPPPVQAEQPALRERETDEFGAGANVRGFALGQAPQQRTRLWRYEPGDRWLIDVRSVPDVNGPRTGSCLQAGEVFRVSEEWRGADGVLYLRLADGRGWVFEQKPGVGTMCVRAHRPIPPPLSCVAEEAAQDAQFPRQLTGPFQQPADNQLLLQLATQMAAQTAKDHHPGAVPWARSGAAHLLVAARGGGA